MFFKMDQKSVLLPNPVLHGPILPDEVVSMCYMLMQSSLNDKILHILRKFIFKSKEFRVRHSLHFPYNGIPHMNSFSPSEPLFYWLRLLFWGLFPVQIFLGNNPRFLLVLNGPTVAMHVGCSASGPRVLLVLQILYAHISFLFIFTFSSLFSILIIDFIEATN